MRAPVSHSRPPLPAGWRQHDDPTGFSVELDFLRELRLIQQWLGNSYALGVADSNDSCLGRHRDYSVITRRDSRKVGGSAD